MSWCMYQLESSRLSLELWSSPGLFYPKLRSLRCDPSNGLLEIVDAGRSYMLLFKMDMHKYGQFPTKESVSE